MRLIRSILFSLYCSFSFCGFTQFAPPPGEVGSTAIHKDSIVLIDWAVEVVSFDRGLEDIAFPEGLYASFGDSSRALGYAEGSSVDVVSLGDNGSITLAFNYAIENGDGPDFAVFENSFSDTYLEFAHVEVSTDGERFVRFPSVSNIQTDAQTATYATSDPTLVHNLAGKYRQAYGTPFDLQDLVDSSGIDLMEINFIRIVDVVGSIDPMYGTYDSQGHLINDPYPTDFESGGFDLDGVGVIHNTNPLASIEKQEDLKLSVYPNPTNGLISIRVNEEVSIIKLYDLAGQLILSALHANQINMDDSNLRYGLYLLEVTLQSGSVLRQQIIYQ